MPSMSPRVTAVTSPSARTRSSSAALVPRSALERYGRVPTNVNDASPSSGTSRARKRSNSRWTSLVPVWAARRRNSVTSCARPGLDAGVDAREQDLAQRERRDDGREREQQRDREDDPRSRAAPNPHRRTGRRPGRRRRRPGRGEALVGVAVGAGAPRCRARSPSPAAGRASG